MSFDAHWCHEHPNEAAAEIERLRAALKVAKANLEPLGHCAALDIIDAALSPHNEGSANE